MTTLVTTVGALQLLGAVFAIGFLAGAFVMGLLALWLRRREFGRVHSAIDRLQHHYPPTTRRHV